MIRRVSRSLRSRLTGAAIHAALAGTSRVASMHPAAQPGRHDIEVIRDVAYKPSGNVAHTLDIYRPRDANGLNPVMLYVHGGGFRILSKESHWMMGLGFARRGYVVFNINYRLAPKHRFPAAIEDACAAAVWTARNATRFGGDPGRTVFAGESAGGGLVSSLAVASCYEREEPYAREVWDLGVVPRAVIASCGVLQVSNPERFGQRMPHMSAVVADQILKVSRGYLPKRELSPDELAMADPLVVIEEQAPDRDLPPFFVFAGTRDPLLSDSKRMKAALDARDVPAELHVYPGEMHAFHAVVFRKEAQQCWRDQFRFLDAHV